MAEDSLGAKDFVGSKNASRKNLVSPTSSIDPHDSVLDLLLPTLILRCS